MPIKSAEHSALYLAWARPPGPTTRTHAMATPHATFVSTEEMLADASAQEGLPARVGRVLDKTVARNDEAAQRGSQDAACRSAFECHSPCPLLPSRYVERIMKYTQCSPCTLVVAIVYLQRLKDREASGPSAAGAGCQPLRLTSFNIQRMFLTAMMIAHKFLDEPVCSNKQWRLVGDLQCCGRCSSTTAMSPAPIRVPGRVRGARREPVRAPGSTGHCPSSIAISV